MSQKLHPQTPVIPWTAAKSMRNIQVHIYRKSFVQLTQLNCAAQSTGDFLFHSSVPFLQTAIAFDTSTNVSKTNSSITFFFLHCFHCCRY